MNPIFYIDWYKAGHREQYPKGITQVWSNWTPRTTKVMGADHIVNFGLTYFIKKYLQEEFEREFFQKPTASIVSEYRDVLESCLGIKNPKTHHIEALHKLGYLPIRIYSLPEGASVPLQIPPIIITNTHPDFFWLPNYFETLLSAIMWKPSTSATTAQRYRKLFLHHARRSGETDFSFVDWMGHDFSFRGMSGVEDAILSGMGHLTCFSGTDTVPAVLAAKKYYGAALTCGGSVPATEHSVMSAGSQDGEFETFQRLLTEAYPSGIVSIVSDTWDLWKVLTDYIPRLKGLILDRSGKIVIRPDSGDPVKIICGLGRLSREWDAAGESKRMGTLQLLALALGTTGRLPALPLINNAGAIYGDSITVDRADEILTRMVDELKLSPYNMVFGIGSYCVTPKTEILCGDMQWREAGSLPADTEIIGFDEYPNFGQGKHASRCYRRGTIVWNKPARKECARIQTDIGVSVDASIDHPWLVWLPNRSSQNLYLPGDRKHGVHVKNSPRTAGLGWKTTAELRRGDKIAYLGQPYGVDQSREGGWLAGMFDGEGCLSRSNGEGIPSWKINISQNQGRTLDELRRALYARGFTFYENPRKCRQIILTGGWSEVVRFLGVIAPQRLIDKMQKISRQMPALKRDYTYQLATVQGVDNIGTQEVASIQTSCGTFITAGYLSHNTYEYVTRDTYGWAMKATAIRRYGKVIPIWKKPVTDDGGKFSAKGILAVNKCDGVYVLKQEATEHELNGCAYETAYKDGELLIDPSFDTIRQRVRANL